MLKWRKKWKALEEERIKGEPEGRWKGWGRAVGWGGVGGCGWNRDQRPSLPSGRPQGHSGSTPKYRGRPCANTAHRPSGKLCPLLFGGGLGEGPQEEGFQHPCPRAGALQPAPQGSSGDEAPVAPRVAVIMLHIQLLGASCLSSLPHWSLLPNKLPELSPLLRSTAGGFGTKTSISFCPWYEVPPLPTCPP